MQRHIDVFEQVARMNAADAFGGLDEVVAGLAGLFTTEDVGEDERLGELTGSHEEARAVDGPWAFHVHNASPLGGGLLAVSGCWLLVSSFSLGDGKRRAKNVMRPIAAARGWFPGAK
jgi:hypothetical protein